MARKKVGAVGKELSMLANGTEYSQYNLLVKGGNVPQPTQSNHKQMYL